MRIFLILVFLISGIFLTKAILSDYFTGSKEKKEIEKEKGKDLASIIVVPIGMYSEYKKIDEKYLKLYSLKERAGAKSSTNLSSDKQRKDIKSTPLKENKSTFNDNSSIKIKEDSSSILENKNITKVKTIEKDNQIEVISTKNEIENKILSYKVVKDELILDIVLLNSTKLKVSGLVKVSCELMLGDQIVSVAQKNGEMEINVNEKIRIKNLNLGFMEYVEFDKIICKVK